MKFVKITTLLGILSLPVLAYADESLTDFSSIHLVWLAICSALVLFMQAGFALLESGLARAKNSVNVIMKNITDIGVGSIGYWAIGFGLMFGVNESGLIGKSMFFPSENSDSNTLYIVYQMMFAATAATIVSGAIAERFSYFPYIVAAFLITTVVYPIYGSWAWGGNGTNLGWLRELGFIDAAGGSVVHSVGGWAALAGILVVGPRLGRYSRKGAARDIPGHNLPLFSLGGFILWLGWFGFNGGAAESDFSDLGLILLNTHLGAVSGICGALLFMLITKQDLLISNAINGVIGGLVAITAGCKTMDPSFAILTGFIAGVIVVVGRNALNRLRIDDMVGAVAVHGFCGAWGTLATGMFFRGDLFDPSRMVAQLIGTIAAFAWAFPTSLIIFKLIDMTIGVRASTIHEQRGLDFSEHAEIGYGDFMGIKTHGSSN